MEGSEEIRKCERDSLTATFDHHAFTKPGHMRKFLLMNKELLCNDNAVCGVSALKKPRSSTEETNPNSERFKSAMNYDIVALPSESQQLLQFRATSQMDNDEICWRTTAEDNTSCPSSLQHPHNTILTTHNDEASCPLDLSQSCMMESSSRTRGDISTQNDFMSGEQTYQTIVTKAIANNSTTVITMMPHLIHTTINKNQSNSITSNCYIDEEGEATYESTNDEPLFLKSSVENFKSCVSGEQNSSENNKNRTKKVRTRKHPPKKDVKGEAKQLKRFNIHMENETALRIQGLQCVVEKKCPGINVEEITRMDLKSLQELFIQNNVDMETQDKITLLRTKKNKVLAAQRCRNKYNQQYKDLKDGINEKSTELDDINMEVEWFINEKKKKKDALVMDRSCTKSAAEVMTGSLEESSSDYSSLLVSNNQQNTFH